MAKYKITVEELTEYPETTLKYETSDGKRYVSTYQIPDGVNYKEVTIPTGAMLKKHREVYTQEIELDSLDGLIKAANGIE